MTRRPTLVWFRRDLRLHDHPALHSAAHSGPVICLFVLDPALLGRRHHSAPVRLRFLRAGLEALDAELAARGSGLCVREGPPELVVPRVAREVGASAAVFTREVSPYGRARDARVSSALAAAGVEVRETGGDLVVEPAALPGPSGGGYRVFTAFHRAWRGCGLPPALAAPAVITGDVPEGAGTGGLPGGAPPLPAGPAPARARLRAFVLAGAADRYGEARDALAEDGTSRLSPYLRLGMCTTGQIGRELGLPGPLSPGREAFWRQLAWREFAHHILARNPEAARTALRPDLRRIVWEDDPGGFAAWRAGETGYPLVDAAMRQLAQTGWMQNRARMVAASFLVKDLLIDWRRGETAFMRALLDGDPASNNAGWQWTAGTGTDAAPYFRVLNPVRQGTRFDAAGAYVRRFVPELRDVPDRLIQEPWRMSAEEQRGAGCRIGRDYPAPRVDHRERRELALDRFRRSRDAAG